MTKSVAVTTSLVLQFPPEAEPNKNNMMGFNNKVSPLASNVSSSKIATMDEAASTARVAAANTPTNIASPVTNTNALQQTPSTGGILKTATNTSPTLKKRVSFCDEVIRKDNNKKKRPFPTPQQQDNDLMVLQQERLSPSSAPPPSEEDNASGHLPPKKRIRFRRSAPRRYFPQSASNSRDSRKQASTTTTTNDDAAVTLHGQHDGTLLVVYQQQQQHPPAEQSAVRDVATDAHVQPSTTSASHGAPPSADAVVVTSTAQHGAKAPGGFQPAPTVFVGAGAAAAPRKQASSQLQTKAAASTTKQNRTAKKTGKGLKKAAKKTKPKTNTTKQVDTVLVLKPTNNDVLFGRGAGISRHPGNIKFRALCGSMREAYQSVRCNDKTAVAQVVLDMITQHQDPAGRFLEKVPKGYAVATPRRVMDKACQALREQKWTELTGVLGTTEDDGSSPLDDLVVPTKVYNRYKNKYPKLVRLLTVAPNGSSTKPAHKVARQQVAATSKPTTEKTAPKGTCALAASSLKATVPKAAAAKTTVTARSSVNGEPTSKIDQAIEAVFGGDEHAFVKDVKKLCVDGDLNAQEYSRLRLPHGESCKNIVHAIIQYFLGHRPSKERLRWKKLVLQQAKVTATAPSSMIKETVPFSSSTTAASSSMVNHSSGTVAMKESTTLTAVVAPLAEKSNTGPAFVSGAQPSKSASSNKSTLTSSSSGTAPAPVGPAAQTTVGSEHVRLSIGTKIYIYWPLDYTYYVATVCRRNDPDKLHYVQYEADGVTEWIDLSKQTYKLVQ